MYCQWRNVIANYVNITTVNKLISANQWKTSNTNAPARALQVEKTQIIQILFYKRSNHRKTFRVVKTNVITYESLFTPKSNNILQCF